MKNERKPKALKLLEQGIKIEEVAEQTGYSIRRVYQLRSELTKNTPAKQKPPAQEIATTAAPLQLQSDNPVQIDTWIDSKLQEAMETLLQHLERDVDQTTIDGIVQIADLLNSLRTPSPNITELFHETRTANKSGTGLHEGTDEGQDTTRPSTDAENFVDILEKTSDGTKETD